MRPTSRGRAPRIEKIPRSQGIVKPFWFLGFYEELIEGVPDLDEELEQNHLVLEKGLGLWGRVDLRSEHQGRLSHDWFLR